MMADIAPTVSDIQKFTDSGWRMMAHNRQHPEVKRSSLGFYASFGGFSNDQVQFIGKHLTDMTTNKSLVWNVLLPALIEQLVKRILKFTDEELEKYMDSIDNEDNQYLQQLAKKKKRKPRKQQTPTKCPRL